MVSPQERAYQILTLSKSKCHGCRSLAELLVDHPDATRLECHVCDSAYEPNRAWYECVIDLPEPILFPRVAVGKDGGR